MIGYIWGGENGSNMTFTHTEIKIIFFHIPVLSVDEVCVFNCRQCNSTCVTPLPFPAGTSHSLPSVPSHPPAMLTCHSILKRSPFVSCLHSSAACRQLSYATYTVALPSYSDLALFIFSHKSLPPSL